MVAGCLFQEIGFFGKRSINGSEWISIDQWIKSERLQGEKRIKGCMLIITTLAHF
jgi:hypothetical protein